jgi:shikimate dehydrogenase
VTLTDRAVAEAVVGADLVVNATPVGMAGGADETRGASGASGAGGAGGAGGAEHVRSGPGVWLVAPDALAPGQVAADLVYTPRVTPWLAEAERAGATVLDGLGMLVHQAAAQLRLWTGEEPPVGAMWAAAEAARPKEPVRGGHEGPST